MNKPIAMPRVLPALLLGLLLLAPPRAARAVDTSSVASAVELYHHGDFEACITLLSRAVPGLERPQERAQAHLFLGLAQAVLGQWVEARTNFHAALVQDPSVAPDEGRVPPGIVAAFRDVRLGIKGRLEVDAAHPCRVLVDDVEVGATPFAGDLAVGKREIALLSKDRYWEARTHVLIRAGERVSLQPELQERPGLLDLDSNPAGAEVWLGSKNLGRTPLVDLRLSPGPVELVLHRAGYEDAVVRLVVPPAERLQARPALRPAAPPELPPPPTFGPDTRPDQGAFDAWAALGMGGVLPLAGSADRGPGDALAFSGGLGLGFEIGAGLYDLVQLGAVAALETFGPDPAWFDAFTPDALTAFTLDPGTSGAMHVRAWRVGLNLRVIAARIGPVHPFLGIGYHGLPSLGRITQVHLPTTSGAKDEVVLTANLSGSAVTPSLGVRYNVLEGVSAGTYYAFDVLAEARLELARYSVELDAAARPEGAARAGELREQLHRALGDRTTTRSFAFLLWASARI